jgi:hypothetical protein
MKIKKITISLLFLMLSLTVVLLVGCSQPATTTGKEPGELDATQAYQTVDAQLTQAVAQTPVPPTATNMPEPVAASTTPGDAAAPEQPTATVAPAEPTATFLPTFTQTPATRCDQAEAAYPSIDITIPDDTEIPAGNSFTKVWRVVNTGTCNWTAEYTAVFFSGEQMQAPDAVNITEPVAPGQSIDIAVTMIAPDETGTYQGNWMLQNADGENFGIGINAIDSFWVRIVVAETEDTPTPTASPAPEPDALVSGSATLNADEGVDLDTLQLNTSGSDLRYQQVTDGETVTGHQLVSLSGVSASIYGTGQPTYGQCAAAEMGAVTLDLEDTASGTYICYTTNQGLTGWARFDALDTENGAVSITVLTWAALE